MTHVAIPVTPFPSLVPGIHLHCTPRLEYIFAHFVLLRGFVSSHVLPANRAIAGHACNVGHGVHACGQHALMRTADQDIGHISAQHGAPLPACECLGDDSGEGAEMCPAVVADQQGRDLWHAVDASSIARPRRRGARPPPRWNQELWHAHRMLQCSLPALVAMSVRSAASGSVIGSADHSIFAKHYTIMTVWGTIYVHWSTSISAFSHTRSSSGTKWHP